MTTALVCCVLVCLICSKLYDRYVAREASLAREIDTFNAAAERLDAWRAARPLLYVGQCAYARSLVHEMIDAYMRILAYDGEFDEELLAHLHQLLEEAPPPHGSPLSEPLSAGVLFYPIGVVRATSTTTFPRTAVYTPVGYMVYYERNLTDHVHHNP